MTLREALEILNKEKFNLNYHDNERYWVLTIFDDEYGIKYESEENRYLSNVLSDYLGSLVEVKNEFYLTENEMCYLKLNYDNTDINNYIYLEICQCDNEAIEICSLNQLVDILEDGVLIEIKKETDIQIQIGAIETDKRTWKSNGI